MKTRKRRQDPDAEYNFWQPATDMMSALVYVLLLIIALLGHANITTTLNLYVHPNMEQKKKCIAKMFKSLGK